MTKAISLMILFAIFLVFIPRTLKAYESDAFNLKTPVDFEKGKIEFKIQHRFKGKINEKPLGSFFGIDYAGATVGLNLRYIPIRGLDVYISRVWSSKEYTLGIGYAQLIPGTPLSAQVDAQFFTYKEYNLEKNTQESQNGLFGMLSLQSKSILGRITPVVNVGYDTHEKFFGAGLGLIFTALKGLGVIEKINLIGEFYPTTSENGDKNALAFGIRLVTYSHQFDFILGNNSHVGVRHLMAGTLVNDEGLRFGFNIKKLL